MTLDLQLLLDPSAPDPFPFVVYVGWGEAPENGFKTDKYCFATEAERAAFLLGVSEAHGWAEYSTFATPHVFDGESQEWVPTL